MRCFKFSRVSDNHVTMRCKTYVDKNMLFVFLILMNCFGEIRHPLKTSNGRRIVTCRKRKKTSAFTTQFSFRALTRVGLYDLLVPRLRTVPLLVEDCGEKRKTRVEACGSRHLHSHVARLLFLRSFPWMFEEKRENTRSLLPSGSPFKLLNIF